MKPLLVLLVGMALVSGCSRPATPPNVTPPQADQGASR